MIDRRSAGPDSSPGYWLHHAALVWRQACEAGLGETTYPQFNVLSAVSLLTGAEGQAPTQQQVADFARMDRMMTSKLAHTLEERGMLTRAPDPEDARRQRLALTAEGTEVLRTCIAAARRADEEIFGAGPDVEALRERLRAVAERRPRGPVAG
jgi:DNA-binding MarR family transcriptional regulator